MKFFYSDTFVLPLPAGHRFPMEKYRQLREALAGDPAFAVYDFTTPEAATFEELLRAHDPDYVRRVLDGTLSSPEIRAIGFPWSSAMVERSRRSAGATLTACREALAQGWAANLAGGTHHAHHDRGAGFCVFNDAVVAARAMQAEARAARVVVIDCDVHQGDGTASIADGDPSIFTFSIHGARNFPFRKARSDLDIELPDDTGDRDYLAALADGLDRAFAAARADLAIYLAGADPFVGDRLGRLALTHDWLAARDRLVFSACRQRGVPVAIAMAGGYAADIADTVRIHATTVRTAAAIFG